MWRVVVGVAFVALGAELTGCLPSAEHQRCLDRCQSANDRCLLDAMDSRSVTRCDGWTRACVTTCPSP